MRPIRSLTLILILGAAPLSAQDTAARAPSTDMKATAPTQPTAGMTLKEVRDLFAKVDADHSGLLTAEEALRGGLDAAAVAAADSDNDQKLSLDEFTVGTEGRVAKAPSGAAADLTAESTRLQALRRAQKSEELKSRRDAQAPGSARIGAQAGGATTANGTEIPAAAGSSAATTPPSGPAAARHALTQDTPAEKEKPAQEIRADILRRVRNAEISPEQAKAELEAIDRRIANTSGTSEQPKSDGALPSKTGAEATSMEHDLRGIEESLHRRLRNSELDPTKAQDLYGDTVRRLQNARGTPETQVPGQAAIVENPLGFRARIAEAQTDLTRRFRNADVTPEQAAIEEAALIKRLRGGADGLKGGASVETTGSTKTTGGTTTITTTPGAAGLTPGATDLAKPVQPPARLRVGGASSAAPAPAATTGNPPARRASDPSGPTAPPAPPVEPARGTSPVKPPAGQPGANPPAPPAQPTPKPAATPAGGGGTTQG